MSISTTKALKRAKEWCTTYENDCQRAGIICDDLTIEGEAYNIIQSLLSIVKEQKAKIKELTPQDNGHSQNCPCPDCSSIS
jgi:predicted nucleotide-binding protein